jgi:hypothetical protein
LKLEIFGLVLSAWFGIRSMFQSLDREALQTALRAYNQGIYNNLWRMGANAETVTTTENLAQAQRLAQGIADMSQTARQTLIAFSREHARFIPLQEAAWDPNPLGPEPKRSPLRWLFGI